MNIYVASTSFYDTECDYPICVGQDKKKVIKRAVEILREEHKKDPFPPYFFGEQPLEITSHFVKIEEIPYISWQIVN